MAKASVPLSSPAPPPPVPAATAPPPVPASAPSPAPALRPALTTPRSTRFREEREARWAELQTLVRRLEGRGRLSTHEVAQLSHHYTAALSALSVARAVSLDRHLVRYLEDLCTRAYLALYGRGSAADQGVGGFLSRELPRAVRRHGLVLLLSAIVLAAGVAVGWLAVLDDPRWFTSMMPAELAAGRTPEASPAELRRYLYGDDRADIWALLVEFGTHLFSHNSMVGLLSFGLGFAFGVPTLALLFYNGLLIGAMLSIHHTAGLLPDFAAWLAVHGTTEIPALLLFAAAGLNLGSALAWPGRRTRMAALAEEGRRTSVLVTGGIAMLFVAAILESVFRQAIDDMAGRLAIGGGMAVFWTAYLMLAGRRPGLALGDRGGDGLPAAGERAVLRP